MRLLIACRACHRQYDVTGQPIGGRFRCRCGEVLTIARPQGHDAAVVRCASCGAPRREGSSHCSFCGADFTLREQDLNTICPHCLARISDRAKFCDHCGNPLAAEPLEIEETPLVCPVCGEGRRLNSRLIDGSSVFECQSCAGIWIGTETFRQLMRQAGEVGQHMDHRTPAPADCAGQCHTPDGGRGKAKRAPVEAPLGHAEAALPQPPSHHHTYVPCPVCRALMVRQNFAHRSGVIVDVCKRHGVWFDAAKLACLLEWVRSGGLAAANEEQQAKNIRDARVEGRLVRERLADSPTFAYDDHDREGGAVERAIDIIGSLFGL